MITFTDDHLLVRRGYKTYATPLTDRLRQATPTQRENVEWMESGLHWPDVDEDISFEGMRPVVWVCLACGKRSYDQFGDHPITHGWDVSCYTHSVQAYGDNLTIENKLVKHIPKEDIIDGR